MTTPSLDTKIWLALKDKLEALTLSPELPFLWPGHGVDLPAGRALEVMHMVNRPARIFIGSADPHDRRGILQIGLLSPVSSNEHAETVAREIAGTVAAHFVVDEPMIYEGVDVRVYEAPEVGASFKDEPRQRVITPVSVRWRTFA